MIPSYLRKKKQTIPQKDRPVLKWMEKRQEKKFIIPQFGMLCDQLDFEKSQERSIVYREDGGPLAERVDELDKNAKLLGKYLAEGEEISLHFRGYLGYSVQDIHDWMKNGGLRISFGVFDERDKDVWKESVLKSLQELEIKYEEVANNQLILKIVPIPYSNVFENYNNFTFTKPNQT